MAILVADPFLEHRLIAERRASGADRYDEVWEGIYIMVPMPNDEHQQMVMQLGAILQETIGWSGLGEVRPGINLSDRREDWEQNYRVPDIAAFLSSGPAENCGTHWRGGADFLVEITSPGDRTLEKLPFYSRLGVLELLVVDRQSWALVLYRRQQDQLVQIGRSTTDSAEVLHSETVPLTFRLVSGEKRPQIEVTHVDTQRLWSV